MRSIFPVVAVFLCVLLNAPAKGNEWTGAGADNLWTNADNWSQGIVPLNATSHPGSGWDDPTGPFYPLTSDTSDDGPLWNNDVKLQADGTVTLIDDTVSLAAAYGVRVGNGGATNILHITGGRLDIGGIPPSGGPRIGWHLQVGRGYPGFDGGPMNLNPTATVLMTGGTVNTNGLLIPEQFVNHDLPDPTDSAPLNGELIMSGGKMNARWMNLGQLKGNGRAELSGDAELNLWPNLENQRNNGGMLIFNRDWYLDGQPVPSSGQVSFDIRDNATVNIFGHFSELRMTPDQLEVDRYQQYIDSGWLTANNGTDAPLVTLQECPDDGTFDEFCISGMMITLTAPMREVTGDFDNDDQWDCADINALVEEIVAGTNRSEFDLNGDNIVDMADITDEASGWLTVGGANNPNVTGGNPFLVGDANLDGAVDVSDFNIWNGSKFTVIPAWCSADFNADGSVDVSDFNSWNSNKFQSSDAAAVPEPESGWICVVGVLLCLRRRRIWRRHVN